MRFQGKIYRNGKFWLAEIPILDAMTQGYTREEAYRMVKDLLETLADRPEFSVEVHRAERGNFEVSASDMPALIGLMLRRQRGFVA